MASAFTFLGLVATLTSAHPNLHEQAERITGFQFKPAMPGYHNFFEASNIQLADGRLTYMQFAEPGNNPGSWAQMFFDGRCINITEVKSKFAGLSNLGEEYRDAHSSIPPTLFHTWKRRESWGSVDFEFAENRDCLVSAWIFIN
jgi:hypothetical protein